MPETLGKSLQEIDVVWDAKMASARSLLRRLSPSSVVHHRARAPTSPSSGAGMNTSGESAENLPAAVGEAGIELRPLAIVENAVKTS